MIKTLLSWAARIAVAGLVLSATLEAQSANVPEKPNFIFILADDMGYGDIGPFGSTRIARPTSTAWRRKE